MKCFIWVSVCLAFASDRSLAQFVLLLLVRVAERPRFYHYCSRQRLTSSFSSTSKHSNLQPPPKPGMNLGLSTRRNCSKLSLGKFLTIQICFRYSMGQSMPSALRAVSLLARQDWTSMQRAVDQPSQPQGEPRQMDFGRRLGLDGSGEGVRHEMGSDFQGVGRKKNRAYH